MNDPTYSHETKNTFSKLYDPLHYDEAIADARAVWKEARTHLSAEDFAAILTEVGAEAVPKSHAKTIH